MHYPAVMGQFCTSERDGHLLVVTIERPEVYNALHPMANQELSDAFDAFATDPELWVAIITGAGDKAFCTGNDLKYHAELRARTGERPVHPPKGFAGLTARFDLDKPVIAAVNGIAMGGGFEIALACDLIVASDRASFAFPEPRVGLAAGAGGLQRLPRAIPLKHAMGMLLTGRRVPAEEGYRLGFVTAVVPHAELMAEARRWAGMILECSPMSVRATKQVALRALDVPVLEAAMQNANYPAYVAMSRSDDAIEGPKAFAEKRKPVWRGR
jgi:enoyl-CoA hydratase/carnithine racemase